MRRVMLGAAMVLLVAAAGAQTPVEIATALSEAFSQAAELVKPSVANISTTTVIPGRRDPFAEWFGMGGFSTPAQEIHSLGSGVVIREDGYVITNYHVVRDAQSIMVALGDDTELPATVRGSDPASDLAVVKVEATGLTPVQWGDSDALRVGEWVIAIGSPNGLRYSVTAGIVSAKGRRDVGIATVEDFIQTDATINPGNSGGALTNLRGQLIGIPTAIMSKSGGYEGVGFAIPSNAAREIAEALIEQGRYPRGWVGVITTGVSRRRAQLAGTAEGEGLMVDRLYRDSPADQAGLQPGDIVTRCNGEPVTGLSALVQAIADAGTNGTLKLEYVRLQRVGNRIQAARGAATVQIVPQPVDGEGRTPQGV
jgi:serine protease Do